MLHGLVVTCMSIPTRYLPQEFPSPSIGLGHVLAHQYQLQFVHDPDKNAWAHWRLKNKAPRAAPQISYSKMLNRTGFESLPGLPFEYRPTT